MTTAHDHGARARRVRLPLVGTITGLLAASFFGGCVASSSPMPREVGVGSSIATPADLPALAAEVRASGGYVFVGEVLSIEPAEPALAPGPTAETRLASPMALATFSVTDDLGAALPSTLSATARSGPAFVVDESGAVDPSWTVSGQLPEYLAHIVPPEPGTTYVFFVWELADGSGPLLGWVAAIDGGVVSGEMTRSGASASLDDLRI